MKQKGNIIVIVLVSVILLAIIGFLVYQNMQLKKQAASPSPTPSSAVTAVSPVSASIATATPGTSLTPGWKLYTNNQYGFEFSYPSSYKVLTDAENLYGWPKAILLLYKGGQSYDLAVEVWNTEAEYKAKYTDSSILNVFKTKDGKFITFLNQNKDSEVAEIISTFRLNN